MSNSKTKENKKDSILNKSINISDQEILKPLNLSIHSSKKPIKRLRAWCGDCYQFFEFGPFAKVCQQHVLKKNCNVYECKKKLINPCLSKQCIRKFPNINSENRHTYCVDEIEMLSWDPRLKIQNCLSLSDYKKNFNNFSSSEKNLRKNSFDSIKFSDLNLDLPENSELFSDNLNNNFNSNNCFSNMNTNHNLYDNSIDENNNFKDKNKSNISCAGYLNKKIKKKFCNKINFEESKIDCNNESKNKEIALNNFSNLSKISKIKHKSEIYTEINSQSEKRLISNIKINRSKKKNENYLITNNKQNEKANKRTFLLESFSNDKSSKNKNKEKIKNRKLEKSFESNKDIKYAHKKRNILRFRRKSNTKILNKINNSNKNSEEKKDLNNQTNLINLISNKKNKENFETKIAIENATETKEGTVNANVNGLIYQIGNLKFDNSKNESILEDEILIKQFDNIYFNYNKNIKEGELLSLNESNLDILSAKNNHFEEDFDFLNNSNYNFNPTFISNKNDQSDPIKYFSTSKFESQNLFCNKNIINQSLKSMNFSNLEKKFKTKIENKNNINNTLFKNIQFDSNLFNVDSNTYKQGKNQESLIMNSKITRNNINSDYVYKEIENKLDSDKNALKEETNRHVKFNKINKNILLDSFEKKANKQTLRDIHREENKSLKDCLIAEIVNEIIENSIFSKANSIEELITKKHTYEIENLNFNLVSQLNQIDNESSIRLNNKENLSINKDIELNFLADLKRKENFFNLEKFKEEKIENIFFKPQNNVNNLNSRKNKNYKISDDTHIDDIMQLVKDSTGIPNKVLCKLKDAMKKKGIFNARVLRLFKKKKLGWNFIKKDFAKNCSQIEAICIYLEELLEE